MSTQIVTQAMDLLSDGYLFPAAEIAYLALTVFAMCRDRNKSCNGQAPAMRVSVMRGDVSMGRLSAAYTALAFLVVITTINASPYSHHKTLLIIVNVGALAYLCFVNTWFRRKFLSWTIKASEIEK